MFDETGFYAAFMSDLQQCKQEAIIESPYITASRMELLYPTVKDLLMCDVKIHIITRDPVEHEEFYLYQATNEILTCYEMGINILNILSHGNSLEVMRRIESKERATEMFNFLN